MMLGFWLIIILLGLVLFRSHHGLAGGCCHGGHGDFHGHTPRSYTDPVQIIRERYARGEISSEEFEERKKVLEEGGR